MRRLTLLALVWGSLLPGMTLATEADEQVELETRVCGIKEPFVFWLWNLAAGRADASRLAGLPGVADLSFTTRDNRVLRGYRLGSRATDTRGYLLVLQGNAILADQLLGEFISYVEAGYDVYLYDYRGYGRSQGKRRLQAMVSDVQEIITALNTNAYARHLVYAFSFGGIVLLDGYKEDFDLHRVVIDSSPSRLSEYGCPVAYDPIEHLPEHCTNFMFISGLRDTVVTPAMTKDLLAQAGSCGANVASELDFAHPFMDPEPARHQQRMRMIEQFLLFQ